MLLSAPAGRGNSHIPYYHPLYTLVMKETYRVGMQLRKDKTFHWRTTTVLSRSHMVTNLQRMLREGRIMAFRIYDGPNGDWDWDNDTARGAF